EDRGARDDTRDEGDGREAPAVERGALLEETREVGAVAGAARGVAGEGARDHRAKPARPAAPRGVAPRGDLEDHLLHGLALERGLARDALVEDRAEREDVR